MQDSRQTRIHEIDPPNLFISSLCPRFGSILHGSHIHIISSVDFHPLYVLSPSHRRLRTLRQLQQALQVDTLRPLDRQPQRAIPDQLGQRSQAARDAKGGGVVERFVEAVVVEEHAGAAVDVGEGVLRLAVFLQHAGRDLAVSLDEPEDGVLGDFGAGGGEFHEGFEAWVRFPQHGVSVAGDHLAGLQGRPEVIFHVGVGEGGPDLGLHFEDPAEDFLRCETGNRVSVRLEKEKEWLMVDERTRVVVRQDLVNQRCS